MTAPAPGLVRMVATRSAGGASSAPREGIGVVRKKFKVTP